MDSNIIKAHELARLRIDNLDLDILFRSSPIDENEKRSYLAAAKVYASDIRELLRTYPVETFSTKNLEKIAEYFATVSLPQNEEQ